MLKKNNRDAHETRLSVSSAHFYAVHHKTIHHGDTQTLIIPSFSTKLISGTGKIARVSYFIFLSLTDLIDSFWLLICLTNEAERFCSEVYSFLSLWIKRVQKVLAKSVTLKVVI